MGFLTASLFFLRFWARTRDRLFGIFSLAFVLLASERLFLLFIDVEDETRTYVYLIRLLAFTLLILGIIDKNRQR